MGHMGFSKYLYFGRAYNPEIIPLNGSIGVVAKSHGPPSKYFKVILNQTRT